MKSGCRAFCRGKIDLQLSVGLFFATDRENFGACSKRMGEKNSNHPLDFQPYAKAHPQRDRPAADSHPSMGPSSGLERKAFSLRLT
jgi:hypothetical protein